MKDDQLRDEAYNRAYHAVMDALVLAGHDCTIAAEWMLAAQTAAATDIAASAMYHARAKMEAAIAAINTLLDANDACAKEVDNG